LRPATPPTPAVDSDDLPVLTEVVDGSADLLVAGMPSDSAPPILAPERIDALAREMLFERLPVQRQALADELTSWLDGELPQVIMRVLDGITDQLVAQVTAEARAALLPRLQAALEAEPASLALDQRDTG
jgi:hypothetical protein